MNYWLLIIPLLSSFIGWITLWIAIRMLFHPREPKRILGITFQGIFPKHQPQLAEKLGSLVNREFLSYINIEQRVGDPTHLKKIMPMIETHVDDFLRIKLKAEIPMLSMFIGDKTISSLKKVFMQEIEILFPQVISQFAANLQAELDLERMVISKVAGFSSDKLEGMLKEGLSKEFRFVALLGAAIGFIVGWIQVLIVLALS